MCYTVFCAKGLCLILRLLLLCPNLYLSSFHQGGFKENATENGISAALPLPFSYVRPLIHHNE